jgi:inorganic pyrophosphatase
MVEQRKVSTNPRERDEEEDLETLASQGHNQHYKNDFAFVSKNDPIADTICSTYIKMQSEVYLPIKGGFFLGPTVAVGLFALFISSSTSNLIAFFAFVNAIQYIIFSLWLLGWILEKDIGPRSMQEVAEPIKEGSEGFFMTQYGTIFRLAFLSAIGLFVIYNFREQVPGSELNNYFSLQSQALITSLSFLIGAISSAIAGYAGIWVSVRANLRVAAAARNDYNAAL